jgi:hypothetical protein
MITIAPPLQYFVDNAGLPLNEGYIYVGVVNDNPETAPVTVYWDVAGTQPAEQPLRTVGGFIVREGTQANAYVSGEYSLTVKNKKGQIVNYAPKNGAQYILASDLSVANGSSLIGGNVQNVSTITSLRALSKNSASKYAKTLGYYSITDQGGGYYYLDSSDSSSLDNGGTVIVATDGGRWKLINDGVIHIAQWGNNLANAVDGMPVGGHLKLGAGPYIANFSKTRSDLKITGIGMPTYNSTNTALVGGSIIQGVLRLTGDRLEFGQFGIDCGSAVCAAINGNTSMDCLVVLDATRTIRYQIVARDIKCLVKDFTSPNHNFLFEGVSDSRFENLISRHGNWGLVMKTTNSTADGVISYNCSSAGFTFKSDTGANGTPALRSSVSNIIIDNSGYPAAAQGILLYAATSSLADFTMENYQTRGGDIGVVVLCDTRSVNVNLIRDVVLSNGIIEDPVSMGFKAFGAMSNVLVSNLDIRGSQSNKSIQVFSDVLGIEFSNVTCSAMASNALAVDLAGRFTFNNLRSCVNGDYNSPSWINLAPESALTFKVGAYLGNISYNGVQTWTPTFSNLTTGGSGAVTISGSYFIIGKMIKFRVQIAVSGSATTASTAGSTMINNLPFQPVQNDTLTAVSGVVASGGVGLIQMGGQNAFTPTWAAYNGSFFISGQYFFQP